MKFDRLASYYDWMELFTAGGRLQAARVAWLDELMGRKRVLSVGEGHGRFAEAFVARYPATHLTVLDESPRMLERARRRVGPGHLVEWHCGDLLAWPDARPYDAVVTCFFLDCFPPETLARVVTRLARLASPDAVWLVVDFATPEGTLRRWRARAIQAAMYAFFRPAVGLPAGRLTEPDACLRANGFVLDQRREFEWGLIRADVWRRKEKGERPWRDCRQAVGVQP